MGREDDSIQPEFVNRIKEIERFPISWGVKISYGCELNSH